jgi:hypothetical protein
MLAGQLGRTSESLSLPRVQQHGFQARTDAVLLIPKVARMLEESVFLAGRKPAVIKLLNRALPR